MFKIPTLFVAFMFLFPIFAQPQVGLDYERRIVRLETLMDAYARNQSEFQGRIDTFMSESASERKDLSIRLARLESAADTNRNLLIIIFIAVVGQIAGWLFTYFSGKARATSSGTST